MPNHGTRQKKATAFTIAVNLHLQRLLTCNDSTHRASISASSAIQTSVRVDLIDVTL